MRASATPAAAARLISKHAVPLLTLEHEGQHAKALRAGDAFKNEPGLHNAKHTGSTPVKILETCLAEKGKPLAEPVPWHCTPGETMARALVIGGTLFIGRALVEQLLDIGDDVVIMHRGRGTPFGQRVGEIACDRNDVAAVQAALDGMRFDVVYDNVYDWHRGTTAEQVTAAVTATAKGLRRYVFTSSVAVYPPGGEYQEDVELVPSDYPNPYGANKANTERALFALGREQGIPVATLRPAFIYGEHNPFEREAFFWDRLRAGRPIIIPGDGLATMQWAYSRDVARAAILASEMDVAVGHAYNVANYPPITQIDFVRLLARVAGTDADLVHVPRERLEQFGGGLLTPPYYFGAYLDVPPVTVLPDRVRQELGMQLTPLERGLRETFGWYEQQQRPQPDYSWEDRALATPNVRAV